MRRIVFLLKEKNVVLCFLMAALPALAWWGCHPVVVVHPVRKDLVETVYASGKIVPKGEYSLSALCTGTIVRKFVRDGDTVKKGTLLYFVRNEDAIARADAAIRNYGIADSNLAVGSPALASLSLALENAVVKLQNDSMVYFRWKQLWAENIGTKNNLDQCYEAYQVSSNEKRIAEQRYYSTLNDLRVSRNNAQSLMAAARKDLGDLAIRSDREGVVYQTFKEAGEAVRNSEVVALLGEQGRPMIRLSVDQEDIDRVRPGQVVLVQADATGGRVYEAVVVQVYPVMNEMDQTFRVDARFREVEIPAFIHGSVEANIVIRRKPGVLVLPRGDFSAKDSVRIKENGRERTVVVITGISTADDVEVVSGLTEMSIIVPPARIGQP